MVLAPFALLVGKTAALGRVVRQNKQAFINVAFGTLCGLMSIRAISRDMELKACRKELSQSETQSGKLYNILVGNEWQTETVKKLEASTPETSLNILQNSIEEAYRLASGESVASTAKEPERQAARSSPVASTPAKGLI